MLSRKDYTREEYDRGPAAVDRQLAAYRQPAAMVPGGPGQPGQPGQRPWGRCGSTRVEAAG